MLDILNADAIQYSALVNVALTAFLVVLTGFYAVVTRRMWTEMVEARLAGIRPILQVEARTVRLLEGEHVGGRGLAGTLHLQNVGRGAGYGCHVEVSAKYENDREKTRIVSALDGRVLAAMFPGQDVKIEFEFPAFPTPMDADTLDFLRVEARCRDGEGNFYCLTQSYDLRAIPLTNVVSRTWQLRSEEWRFGRLPGYRRRWSGDFPSDQMTVQSRYRLPRVYDWSK